MQVEPILENKKCERKYDFYLIRLQPQCVLGQQALFPVTVDRIRKIGFKNFKTFRTHYIRHNRNRTIFIQRFEAGQFTPGPTTHDILIGEYDFADAGQY